MSLSKLIHKATRKSRLITIGQHSSGCGYFAFTWLDGEECDPEMRDWNYSGHGDTIEEAIAEDKRRRKYKSLGMGQMFTPRAFEEFNNG